MHTKQQLMELHAEHSEWQNKIRFYKEQLKNFENELSEFVKQNDSGEQMAAVEHFQNQFILQNENLDIMRHDFKQHENEIESIQKGQHANPNASLIGNHDLHREKLDGFEKIFHDLRTEFHSFQTEASQMAL